MDFLPKPPKFSLPAHFRGQAYRMADNWKPFLPVDATKPLRYIEIGAFYGANLLSVAMTYGAHPQSVFVAIDPWTDYSEYPEYKGQQETIYETFTYNVAPIAHKLSVFRDYSHKVLPTLEDDSFDMVYVDGNHEPEYVLEDAVLAFRKLKVGGILIFDDYGWGGPELTQRGVDSFLCAYQKRLTGLGQRDSQIFLRRAS